MTAGARGGLGASQDEAVSTERRPKEGEFFADAVERVILSIWCHSTDTK